MAKKSIACALGLALVFTLLPAALAQADFQGTDLWANLAPHSGGGGLPDKYPFSYYTLDYHVDGPSLLGGLNLSDVPALVAQFLAAFLLMGAFFFMRLTIMAFDWAFNVDIIGGRHGAIHPVADATQNLYLSTFEPLLKDAVLIFGAWIIYKVAARRFGEAGTGAVRAICLTVVALVIIFNSSDTIGRASSLTNELASAIVSGPTGANGRHDASDRLFTTFIAQPWTVLEFGGLKRCVSVEKDSGGFPRYVNGESDHNICHDATTRYAPKFLALAPGSDDRKHLYEDIRDGDSPFDKSDAPAVDLMQAGGATQRLVFTLVLIFGIVSGTLLLGLIAVMALFSQLGLLVLLAATPMMVIAAIFPGTNGIVISWGKWIGKLLVAKVVYAVMLSAALRVSDAFVAAGGTGQIGYLFAYGVQSVLFLGLFLGRKKIASAFTSRHDYNRSEQGAKAFVTGAATGAVTAVSAPLAAAGVAAAKGKERLETIKQEHASNPNTSQTKSQPASGAPSKPPVDASSPPATAGREYSPALDSQGRDQAGSRPASAPVATIPQDNQPRSAAEPPSQDNQIRGEQPVPKTFREELVEAKTERANGKPPAAPERDPRAPLHRGSNGDLHQALEQERAKSPNS